MTAGMQRDVGDHLVDRQHEAMSPIALEPGGREAFADLMPDHRDLVAAERPVEEARRQGRLPCGSLRRLHLGSRTHVVVHGWTMCLLHRRAAYAVRGPGRQTSSGTPPQKKWPMVRKISA